MLPKPIPVHSLVLSSYFFILSASSLFLSLFPVVSSFLKPEDQVFANTLDNFYFLTMFRSVSYSLKAAWIFISNVLLRAV